MGGTPGPRGCVWADGSLTLKLRPPPPGERRQARDWGLTEVKEVGDERRMPIKPSDLDAISRKAEAAALEADDPQLSYRLLRLAEKTADKADEKRGGRKTTKGVLKS